MVCRVPFGIHVVGRWFFRIPNAGGQEPMIVCPGQPRPDNMGVKTYLQIPIFSSWAVANPRTTLPTSIILGLFMYGCRNLRSSRFYVFMCFSPIPQYSGLFRCRHYSSWLFRGLPPERLPLIHNQFWFCMTGIQFPLDHFIDPFPI